MAVVATGAPVYVPFQGQPDIRLPFARWFAEVDVTGDVSGGEMRTSIVFNLSGDPPGPVIGLTRAIAQRRDTVVENCRFTVDGFTQQISVAGADYDITLPATLAYALVQTEWQTSGPGRILGVRDEYSGGSTQLTFQFLSNVNTVVMHTYCEGYIWQQAALGLPGGPQWPENTNIPLIGPPGASSYYERLRAGLLN